MDDTGMQKSFPKIFEGSAEELPLDKQGIIRLDEFKKSEEELEHLLWLKKIGLSKDDIDLYQKNEAGLLENRHIEPEVLKSKLKSIYKKINDCNKEKQSPDLEHVQPSTSSSIEYKSDIYYPEGHPMNDIKKLDHDLFEHLDDNDIPPITKRLKKLRHLERKKEQILGNGHQIPFSSVNEGLTNKRPGSLWDMKEMASKRSSRDRLMRDLIMGPKKPTMYTVRDNKIVRLEPVAREQNQVEEYRVVDIVVPENAAEERLLEGTKMNIDDIRKIDRFKDYEPGIPSKVLYLKNINPSVTLEQLSLLFNQFIQDNGGPIDVRLMTGRMRGQAFVAFENEETCLRALDEVNGTILSGRPVIAQFGRNSNRIQDFDDDDDDDR